eukprot:7426794-Ditylum_brightwellii.AAC.1
MMLGRGAVFSSSTKQMLSMRNSTKVKIIGVDDLMPQVLWTDYFLKAQFYMVKDNIVYQGNESAMQLKKNVKGSSIKRT